MSLLWTDTLSNFCEDEGLENGFDPLEDMTDEEYIEKVHGEEDH